MKKIILISGFLVMSAISIQAQQITFKLNSHDFGTIIEAKGKVTYKFEFSNTGNAPLIVQNVSASCGCTTPEWTKEPILPGKTGFITAIYDPAGRPGKFEKSINVTSNSKEETLKTLTITGEVTSEGLAKPEGMK